LGPEQTEGFLETVGNFDLFIARATPNLGKCFHFQAQYRFNRPAKAGGIHAVTGALQRRRGAGAARFNIAGQGAQAVTSTKELYATGQDRTR
jgi:hypothetical protein